tara:strand:+ start:3073 stop:3252 length:180 start_codon:yes stop_codon:yes gene_type:complete
MIFMVMFTPRVEVMVTETTQITETTEITEITEIMEIMEIKLKFLYRRKREMVLDYVKGQ